MAALGTPIAAVSLNYFARLYICVQPGFLHGLFVQPPKYRMAASFERSSRFILCTFFYRVGNTLLMR